ncbi:hypothetical protein AOQ84DRAFT_357789 [Glonium stellatum]|uniref:N-acetyltransferase domain-containing protein n=1 Tax=Glonium stellatum TaxID=574774 RepID=A0A8E2JLZ2_9PEZI|nr:hypothetical protein AOQ84DRAFT_357789 [Glonium stellatum]
MTSARSIVSLLPKTCADKDAWNKIISQHKEFRLQSLIIAPHAYSSSYECESRFEWNVWENRLKNPDASTFVAFDSKVAQSAEELKQHKLLEQSWSGMLVLVGPSERAMTSDYSTSISTERKQHDYVCNTFFDFRLNAMFIISEARRSGLGMALIEAAIAHGKTTSEDRGITSTRFTAFVNRENHAAICLYQKAGFKVITEKEDTGVGVDRYARGKPTTLMEMWI